MRSSTCWALRRVLLSSRPRSGSRWRFIATCVGSGGCGWFVRQCVPFTIVGAGLGVLPFIPWALTIWLGLLVIAIVWWFSLRPRLDREWAVGMDVQPRAEIVGNSIHVRNFRNFRYTASGEAIPQYEERTYDLTKLLSLDYFLSHWSGPVMAHTLVSVRF